MFKNAEETAKYIIEKALISVVPWDDAGPYLRFSGFYREFPGGERGRNHHSEYILELLTERVKPSRLVTETCTRYSAKG